MIDAVDEFRNYTSTEEGIDGITRVSLSYINALDDVVEWVTAEKTKLMEAGVHAAMLRHLPEKFERDPEIVGLIKNLIRAFRAALRDDYYTALEALADEKKCECGAFRHVSWEGEFVLKCAECGSEKEVDYNDGKITG